MVVVVVLVGVGVETRMTVQCSRDRAGESSAESESMLPLNKRLQNEGKSVEERCYA